MYLFLLLLARESIADLTSVQTSKKVESKIPPAKLEPNPRLAAALDDKHVIGIALGQKYFIGDFSDYAEDNLGIDFYYEYMASMSFGVIGNLHYFSSKKDGFKLGVLGSNASIKVYLYQFDHFAPYFAAGVGFYHLSLNNTYGREFVFGTNLALGFDLILNEHAKLAMLFHYHNPFDLKTDGPKLEGSYLKALLLLSYMF